MNSKILQQVVGIQKAEERRNPSFLNRISILQYKKDFSN